VKSLSEFIRGHSAEILGRWEATVRGRSSTAHDLSRTSLLDHLPQLLARLAEIADGAERLTLIDGTAAPVGTTHLADVHAMQRLDEGFDLGEVVDEFSVLRECILDLWWQHSGAPSREGLRLLDQTISRAIALSVQRYTQAKERTLHALDKISAAALESQDVDTLLQRLLAVFVEMTAAADTAAILLREEGDILRVRATVGLEEEARSGYSVRIGEGFSGTIAAEGRPSLIPDASENPLVTSGFVRARGVRGMYGVPLTDGNRVIGVAHMGSRTARDFSDQDKRLFAAMTNRATAAIAQHLLRTDAQRRHAELEAIVRSIPDAVFIGDESRISVANTAAAELFGFASPDAGKERLSHAVANLAMRDARTGAPIPDDEHAFARALRGETVETEVVVRHRTRDVDVFLRLAAAPIMRGDERLGAVAIATDITRMKMLEREREDFVASVTHDLRTPLSALRSLAQLTSRSLERSGDEANLRHVQRIIGQVDRTNRLLSDLMDVTRAQRGTLTISRVPVDVCALVHEVVSVWSSSSATHPIVVDAPPSSMAMADADRVSQVLDNLLSNAIKYSPQGGQVDVRVVSEGGEVVVSIRDQGLGMKDVEKEKLFSRWSRGADVERIPGTGLGLSVVAELVRAHGGRVWVEAASPGTKVSFSLKAA
jgi:PAS domain S-box-containing protein